MQPAESPRYIFLSHNSDDKPEVRYLADKLESHPLAQQHNLKVWLDERSQDHTKTYVSQFASAIESPTTCAFLLFVPRHSTDGFVQHEIETAFDRRMKDEKHGMTFPILPVYPDSRQGRIELPNPIKGFNYRENVLRNTAIQQEIIEDALGLSQQSGQTNNTGIKTGAVEDHQIPQWLCYTLEMNGEEIRAEDDINTTTLPKNQLLPLIDTEDYSATLEQLFPSLILPTRPARLRIMTDEAELAMLPWRNLIPGAMIEVGPCAKRYTEGFEKIAIHTPLAVIPENTRHGIAGNKHYSALVGYFNSHLNIRGPIPRVSNVSGLKRELELHQPDFIYLYARYDGQHITLDNDLSGSLNTGNALTLDELGDWISQAMQRQQLLRPIVVLSLIGGELKEYPATLAKSCRLLWIQNARLRNNANVLEELLAKALETLSSGNGDMVGVINDVQDKRITSHVWLNGQSPQFNTGDHTPSAQQQLRAALLRVLLGRESLKNSMYGSIRRTEYLNNSSFLAYAVTGDRQACPFDFPAQLQSRIDWEDSENGLPMLPFYFSLTIDPELDPYEQIGDLLDQGLYHRTENTETAFLSMLERRGMVNSDCCIALNWHITLPAGLSAELDAWLKDWGTIMATEIADYVPQRTIMLSALCIQVEDPTLAQTIQDTANQSLHSLRDYGIRLIRNREALGKLQMDEISDFLEYNAHWRENLKLRTYNIDPYHYAGWIYDRTDGEFDQTVNEIWTQYQQDYQDYPKS